MTDNLNERLARCERRTRWLAAILILQSVLLAGVQCTTARPPVPADTLRARELAIVDANGVVRVRVTGDAPDAIVGGKRMHRGDQAAGVILYDGSGQERGGYVTFTKSRNVALTLDSAERQTTLFVATPDGSTALRMWHGADEVSLRTDEDGARVTAVRNGAVEFQQPPIAAPEKTATCAELRDSRSRLSEAEVMGYCRRVMSDDACRKCLSAP